MDTNKRIREMMDERGWSDYKLAQYAGLSQSTISNLFSRSNEPTISTLRYICDAFGVTLAQFFSEGPAVELTEKQYDMVCKWSRLDDRQQMDDGIRTD
ncbi:helix-turn-helix domain-containing protein [Emergencia timonensis]|uniref:helix-turn-helix domain-containing protein n=1 Tax=Emergencia timonensis TaxID=1776384 RepID=UPI001D08E6D8|nr:helix-turn-helix transcriptional regulator [Emergencia timonensis]MCB6477564.1 helix-turn-helix domain-containing protein [Emergencia timonensis]